MVYKILSLDGGGMRAVLSAQLLALIELEIEAKTGQSLSEFFDLIAGTSAGSILASGIALRKSGKELISLYLNQGQTIFPYWGTYSYFSPQRLPLVFQYGISAPKFSHEGLKQVLQQQFGQTTLRQLGPDHPKLLTTAYDTLSREPVIFKSWQTEKWYADVPLWEAALCSASAPTFFPAYPLTYGGKTASLIDGGVGANNPSACALAAAVRLGYNIQDIRLLSLGTGEASQGYPYNQTKHWGLFQWALHIVDVLLDAPIDISDYVTRQVVTLNDQCAHHYLRLQPTLSTDYLEEVLDSMLRSELRQKLKGKTPVVTEDIDDASQDNLNVLMALAEGYYQNGRLKANGKQTSSPRVKVAVAQFLEACGVQ
ncbi:patatin-like phospholipase family protein [Spirulina sp. CS-785/01]|uniref:patatin-like phospholipase family protein n=1 Tax=Spirulina sp. CS-785/01 TaxID=3021716 RepID=UPI00232F7EC3|nr:patatin-like phospholipase family protein [Spirulina sp. CS-785/01]MDB9314544.1 patatin-like phospholipase family protein [Spirulina sp. CS-785/01]